MRSLNVLITAASRRVPLIRAFQRALRELGARGAVIVTDVNALSPGVHVADRAFQVPMATDSGYIDAIETICHGEGIRLVVPTIDDELPLFGAARERFAAAGIQVAASDRLTAELCNDKFLTSHYLSARDVPVADSYLPGSLPSDLAFPVFVKPRYGRGGVGAFAARTPRELAFFLDYVACPVVQTFLDGPEYTIDVLTNFDGEVVSVVPRERVVIRAGKIDRGRTVNDSRLIKLGAHAARALRVIGAANVQCRDVEGEARVFEVNPRFSGGIPLTIAAGGDFPRFLLEMVLGVNTAPPVGEFTADLWMTSYETTIFLGDGAEGALRPYHPRQLREVG